MFLSFISWETTGWILLLPLLILLPGVAIAAMAGLPTFFLVRTWESYAAVASDYRTAVGLSAEEASSRNGNFRIPWGSHWGWIYLGYIFISYFSPALGFSVRVLALAGITFHYFQRALNSWAMLRVHPGLDRRLKRVPITEICAYGAVAVVSLVIFHGIVVLGPPKPSPSPIINQDNPRS
ncbi:MAG: hypothetical protein EOP86_02880 [Verrucomicrobiaceae bacterium]|nr:MAG: hypothetical protein EOP86_02880 [Verrucomicrobiaceae bacterium]